MRILFQTRVDLSRTPAGDTVQLLETKRELERLGVDVCVTTDTTPDLRGYSLTHIFNLMKLSTTYPQWQHASGYSTPIVLSTIYWNPEEYLSQSTGTAGVDPGWFRRNRHLMQEIAQSVDMLLPNSNVEAECLSEDLTLDPDAPFTVVPNGASLLYKDASCDWFERTYRLREFVLCVGRVSRRKNQAALIRALKSVDVPLVFVGDLNDPRYYLECRQERRPRTYFLGSLPHPKLASAYASARVHANPSWYDTPGLVSLEAALSGTPIVSTDRGSAREYFGDLALYCSPEDPGSIGRALAEVLRTGRRSEARELKQIVEQRYTWRRAAELTLQAYRRVLQSR